jgi:hypothetical protein
MLSTPTMPWFIGHAMGGAFHHVCVMHGAKFYSKELLQAVFPSEAENRSECSQPSTG